jgi:hypothetical protein
LPEGATLRCWSNGGALWTISSESLYVWYSDEPGAVTLPCS